MHFIIEHTIYINSSGAVIRELLQQMCITQPANICFVHSYKQDKHRTVYLDDIVLGHTESKPMFVYATDIHKRNQELIILAVYD
jgi:hypothetical protein